MSRWSLVVLGDRLVHGARARLRRGILAFAGRELGWLLRTFLMRSGARAGVALVYHRVGDPPGDPRHELVPALASALFEAQVEHLVANYRVVTASELAVAVRERRRGMPFPVAITFDDDLVSHADVAAPILKSAGATATFFVSGASLHQPYRFWWERLQAVWASGMRPRDMGLGDCSSATSIHELARRIESLQPHARDAVEERLGELAGPDPPDSGLRSEALRRLAEFDVEIGFHTRRHYVLPELDDRGLRLAMTEGRDEVEQLVGTRLTSISYPHGLGDGRVAMSAAAAGFSCGLTCVSAPVGPASEPLLLGRVVPSYRSVGELAFDVARALLRNLQR